MTAELTKGERPVPDEYEITVRPEVTCRSLWRRWRWVVRATASTSAFVLLSSSSADAGFAVSERRAHAKAARRIAHLRDYDDRMKESERRAKRYPA